MSVTAKQTSQVTALTAAISARLGKTVNVLTEEQGSKLAMLVDEPNWPVIMIGKSGGIDLPQVKSYPKAFEAAVEGDLWLAKQGARDAKRAAKPAPAADPAVKQAAALATV